MIDTLADVRRQLYRDQHGKCGNDACDRMLDLRRWPRPQIAHLLPQDKAMMRKYGPDVIHHPLNLRLVCGEWCNAAVSKRNHPVWEREHVAKIREEISHGR